MLTQRRRVLKKDRTRKQCNVTAVRKENYLRPLTKMEEKRNEQELKKLNNHVQWMPTRQMTFFALLVRNHAVNHPLKTGSSVSTV
jgi:hypothetical protein